MKKLEICILTFTILMLSPIICFGQKALNLEDNTVQINISEDDLKKIIKDKININQKLFLDDDKPIIIKISSMPSEKWFIRYSGYFSGFIGAVLAFLLALLSFRIQRTIEEKHQETKWQKETFDMYISLLIEMKRALDRCKGMSQMKGKSLGRLYVGSEQTIFAEYIKRCDRIDIIRKMFAIYHLFDLVNWNIEQGTQIQGTDAKGNLLLNDRYGAALGFILEYLLGASKHYNDLLSYAWDMANKGAGKVDEYLVEYNLEEIESMDGIKNHELH